MHIFTILFLMLGPFKIIGPFTQITKAADPILTKKIAISAFLYSTIALLLAALIGENILSNYGIPIPILAISGGLILFLVAILNIIHQFDPLSAKDENPVKPTINMAIYPLAFPTIVTPYGIAAVIVFFALSPDMQTKMMVGILVFGIMVLNLIFMLINRYTFKYLAVVLPLLGAILGVVQVALGLQIIYKALLQLLKLS
ncbi:MAG: MarC family protein [Chitinophagaceae bacterium]